MIKRFLPRLAIVFVLLAAALAAGCQSRPPEPLPVIRIGYSPHDHHAPLYIAAMNPDYFKEHGGVFLREITPKIDYELVINGKAAANISLHPSPGGEILIRKLAESQYTMALGSVPALISFIDRGSCVKIAVPIMSEGAALVVDTLLPVNNWNEFVEFAKNRREPLRIGYKAKLCNQSMIFEYALRETGLTYSSNVDDRTSNLILLDMHGMKNMLPALENDLIDGFVVNQPLPAQAEYRGIGKIIVPLSELPPTGKWAGNPCCAMGICEDFISANPELVEAIITLIMRANIYIQENQPLAGKQIADWLGVEEEIELLSLPTIKFNTDFDESWHRGVEFWIKTMLETGNLSGRVKKSYNDQSLNELLYSVDLYEKARKNL